MPSLYEHYRPTSMTQVIGQTAAKQAIKCALEFGWGGKAFFISGPSGSGKSTLARIVAKMGADDFFIEDYSGSQFSMEVCNEVEAHMRYTGLGKKTGRAYIIEECHGLRAPVISRLLVTLEHIPKHVQFHFTTTEEGQSKLFDGIDARPLLSRCVQIELTTKRLTVPFAKHAKWIAKRERLDGRPLKDYIALVERCNANFRMVLQEVLKGAMKKA
jgi:DNA polymerase-3 subunit gamma/tau